MATPKQLLLEHVYPGDLPADVRRLLAEKKSWRDVASLVSVKTGQQISHESLRNWYGDPAANKTGAA